MSATDRRTLLKGMALAGGAAAAGAVPAAAYERKQASPGALSLLYDTTLCVGCQACVFACNRSNELEGDLGTGGLHLAPTDLSGQTKNVIKVYQEGDRRSYVKSQCMQCLDPACAAACMLGALEKDPVTGVVGWDGSLCVGCRYCQMACPFNVAKFQFDKAAPKIVKCEYCRHRVQGAQLETGPDGISRYPKGHGPACAETCPRGAVIYGKRDELLGLAKQRIADAPGKYYQDRVYGERDAGGTQSLYLSHVPFAKLGLPELGDESVPAQAIDLQHTLYKGFIGPVALYAILAGVMLRNRRKEAAEEEA
jgi:Fe-S-cluster-containing dehydrogenase component